MASILEMYFMGSGIFGNGTNPPIRVIHAFPYLELAAAYSKTKLNQMITSAIPAEGQSEKKSGKIKSCIQVLLDQTTATNDSLHFKQFSGGNHLWIESTGLNADRIVGRSADVIVYDEVQLTTAAAIGNSLKILTTAKYGRPSKGVQVYVGTPRRKGSDFHKLWLRSSQQYFYLGCESCEEHFPLYTPESDGWKNVWIYGMIVKCPKCGHEQNKLDAQERGKWIAIKDPNDPDCDMIGFHINQIYMPMFTREDIINEMPGIHPLNTERTFMNEVLGEFFQGDSSPITPEEIRENCADVSRKFRARIDSGSEEDRDQLVVMGIDYGAKSDMEQMANPDKMINRGQSFSTAVILTAKDAGRLSIEFCTKFKRNDTESKKGLIDQLMRQYSVQLAVGDIGFSEDFSAMMHTSYGDRYLVSRAHGGNRVNGHVKFNIDAFPKEIVFDRDHYIGEVYEQMKKGMIRFPFGDYEKIAWLIEHCASMEIKPSISRNGDPSIHYVKGTTPNDGFAALINAYIAYKFLITNGFTNNNPLLHQQDFKQANKPLVMTGIISRRI
jgi:ssDNA-binding Zn-finger/Zn-ribbon topoisomerase 1